MECPYCHKEIPQDSAFCYHCGKELNGEKKEIKESKKLKKNPRENSFAKLGILLFFIALIGLDFMEEQLLMLLVEMSNYHIL